MNPCEFDARIVMPRSYWRLSRNRGGLFKTKGLWPFVRSQQPRYECSRARCAAEPFHGGLLIASEPRQHSRREHSNAVFAQWPSNQGYAVPVFDCPLIGVQASRWRHDSPSCRSLPWYGSRYRAASRLHCSCHRSSREWRRALVPKQARPESERAQGRQLQHRSPRPFFHTLLSSARASA